MSGLYTLLNKTSKAALLLDAWERRLFDIAICGEQLDEFARVMRYPKLRKYVTQADTESLKIQLREVAVYVDDLPEATASADPDDNWLLGLAEAAQADYLVSGDKRGLMKLVAYRGTKIVTLARMIELLYSHR